MPKRCLHTGRGAMHAGRPVPPRAAVHHRPVSRGVLQKQHAVRRSPGLRIGQPVSHCPVHGRQALCRRPDLQSLNEPLRRPLSQWSAVRALEHQARVLRVCQSARPSSPSKRHRWMPRGHGRSRRLLHRGLPAKTGSWGRPQGPRGDRHCSATTRAATRPRWGSGVLNPSRRLSQGMMKRVRGRTFAAYIGMYAKTMTKMRHFTIGVLCPNKV